MDSRSFDVLYDDNLMELKTEADNVTSFLLSPSEIESCFPDTVSTKARINSTATVGQWTHVCPYAELWHGVKIGKDAVIEHSAKVYSYAQIADNARLGAHSEIPGGTVGVTGSIAVTGIDGRIITGIACNRGLIVAGMCGIDAYPVDELRAWIARGAIDRSLYAIVLDFMKGWYGKHLEN